MLIAQKLLEELQQTNKSHRWMQLSSKQRMRQQVW